MNSVGYPQRPHSARIPSRGLTLHNGGATAAATTAMSHHSRPTSATIGKTVPSSSSPVVVVASVVPEQPQQPASPRLYTFHPIPSSPQHGLASHRHTSRPMSGSRPAHSRSGTVYSPVPPHRPPPGGSAVVVPEDVLRLFSDDAVVGDSDNDAAVFSSILAKLEEEATTFSSVFVACEAAMSRAEQAAAMIEAKPCQIETAVAAALMLRLIPLTGHAAPLLHRLFRKVCEGTFGTFSSGFEKFCRESLQPDAPVLLRQPPPGGAPTPCPVSAAAMEPHSRGGASPSTLQPRGEGVGVTVGVQQSPIEGSSKPHPLSVNGALCLPALPPISALLELVRVRSFSSRCKQMTAQLAEAKASLTKTTSAMSHNFGTLFRLAARNADRRLALCFRAWRMHARSRRRFCTHLVGLQAVQRNVTNKKQFFLRWVAFTHSAKESRTTSLAAANNETLMARVLDLNQRCTQREDQLNAQRVAKEKSSTRCDRLEEVYTYEKEDFAKYRARFQSLEQEVSRFRRLTGTLLQSVDRLSGRIPLLFGQNMLEQTLLGPSHRRHLNIKRMGQLVLSCPSAAVPNPNATVAMRSANQTVAPSHLMLNDTFSSPFVVHDSGSGTLEEYVDDALLTVLRWLNIAREEAAQFLESSLQFYVSNSKDPFAAAGSGEHDLVRAQQELDPHSAAIRHLGRDLVDGRVYQLLLWRMLSHRYGGTSFLKGLPYAPFPVFESNIERMQTVQKMAALLGVDGGVDPASLVTVHADSTKLHFLFCVRILQCHATCSPHFLQVEAAVHSSSSSSTWNHRRSTIGRLSVVAGSPNTPSASSSSSSPAIGPDSVLTSYVLQEIVQSVTERIDLMERWQSAVTSVANYAAQVSNGAAQLQSGEGKSPQLLTEFLVDRSFIVEAVVPQSLKFLKPFSDLVGNSGQGGTSRGGSASRRGTGVQGAGDDEDPAAWLAAEMTHCFSRHAHTIQLIQWYYAAWTVPDVAELVWDTPSWFRFVQDAKLVTNRHVTKQASDAVFRSLAGSTAAASTAATSLQPAALQTSRLLSSAEAAKRRRSTATSSSATTTHDSGATATEDLENDGEGGNPMYQMQIGKFHLAVVRLFLSRSSNPIVSSHGWTDVDRGLELFREFLETVIFAPSVPRSLVEGVIAQFQTPLVQDVLKTHKEPLRRIFTEVSVRDNATQLSRLKMDHFVLLLLKDTKILTDPLDIQNLYHTARIASGAMSPLRGLVTIPGLDAAGFHVALLILSRIKFGFGLISPANALQQFLTTVLFPACQFRMKLKW